MKATIVTVITFASAILIGSAFATATHNSGTTECSTCHADQVSKPVGHFMETDDDCMFCHELVGNEANSIMTSPSGNLACVACHVANDASMEGGAHAQLDCIECHDPHSSQYRDLFSQAETELCSQSCHGEHDIGAVSHPVGDQVRDETKGTALSCISTCHQNHRPQQPKILQMASLDLCHQCHAEKF